MNSRAGELLKQFNKGDGRPKENYKDTHIVSQTQAAKKAGMSKHKKDQALRLANVDEH